MFRELSHDNKGVEVGWVGLGWDLPIQMCYSIHPFESSPFELADFLSCQRAMDWGFRSPTPTLRIVVRIGWAPCYLNLSWNMVLEDTRIQFCCTSEYIRATKVFCQSRTTKNGLTNFCDNVSLAYVLNEFNIVFELGRPRLRSLRNSPVSFST